MTGYRNVTAGAALLLLVIPSACASGELKSQPPEQVLTATVPATTDMPGPTMTTHTVRTNPTRLEAAFVESVRTDTVTIDGTDAEILAMGYAQCEALDAAVAAGKTVEEHMRIQVLRQFGADEQTAEDAGYVMGLSFTVLCPEYALEAQEAFDALSATLNAS